MKQAKSVYMPQELINWVQELADHQSRSFSYILCSELSKAKEQEERFKTIDNASKNKSED